MEDIEYSWGTLAEHEEKDELRQKLIYYTQELEKLKSERIEEIIKTNEYVNNLMLMLKHAIQQRDEAKNQLQQLINKITFPPNTALLESQPTLVHQFSNISITSNAFDSIIESINQGRALPQKGEFVQAIRQAGPLLHTLLAAVPLPRWRNPPQLQVPSMPIRGGETEPLGQDRASSAEHLVGRENNALSYSNFGW